MHDNKDPELNCVIYPKEFLRKDIFAFEDDASHVGNYIFDRNTLFEWLKIEKSHSSIDYSAQQTGPGQLDKWKAFNGHFDCFFSYPQQKFSRLSILLTYPLLQSFYYPSNILAALYGLVHECDLFLYEGPDKSLLQASPVRSLNELLDGLQRIKAIPASKIVEDKQIFNKKWGMILDYSQYQELLGNSSTTLDFTKIGLLTNKEKDILLASVEREKITTIIINPSYLKQLEYFLSRLPAVDSVKIAISHGNQLNILSVLSKKYSKIKFSMPSLLDYNNKDSLSFFPIQLRSLSEYKILLAKDKTTQVTQLSIITYEEDPWFTSQHCKEIITNFPCLRSLTLMINHEENESFILPDLPHLEQLSVRNCKIIIKQCPNLYYLDLNQTKAKFESAFPSLRIVKINGSEIISPLRYFLENTEYLNLKGLSLFELIQNSCFNTGNRLKYFNYAKYSNDEKSKPFFNSIITGQALRTLKIETPEKIFIDSKASTGLESTVNDLKDKNIFFVEEKFSLDFQQAELFGLSRFNLSATLTGNAPDDNVVTFSGKGEFATELRRGDSEKVPVSTYRISCFDLVSFDEKQGLITFHQASPKKSTSRYLQKYSPLSFTERQINNDPSLIDSGIFEGILQIGQYYPLPLTGPLKDSDFFACYVDLPTGVEIEVLKYDQSCFVHVVKTPADKPAKIHLEYDFTHNAEYENTAPFEPAELPADKALPSMLKKQLEIELKNNESTKFLFNDTLSKQEKLEELIRFCSSFSDEKLKENLKDSTLEQYLAIIKNRCGVCRHRSQIFMLLALLIEIEVQLIKNEVHQLCNIRTKKGGLRCIDFDGGGKWKDGYDRDPAQLQQPNANSTSTDADLVSLYEASIRRRMEQPLPLFSWDIFETHEKPPLIFLSSDTNMDIVRRDYFSQLQYYLFINQPDDFKHYLTSYSVGTDHQRRKTSGPLQQILDQGGILLINWSNFTPEQQSFYRKSIPEQKNLQIIGLISKSISCSSELYNNYTHCQLLPVSPYAEMKKSFSFSQNFKSLNIDLFHAADWYEKLVANLYFTPEGLEIKEQVLLKAVKDKDNISLIIHRPPGQFQSLWRQIQIEKRFWFNGEWISIPDTLHITLSEEPLTPLKNMPILSQAKPESSLKKIFLHRNNWHTLYEQVIYDEKNGTPLNAPGKLTIADQKSEDEFVFYITESIQSEEWEQLALYIAEKYPGNVFQFQLAPGVSGPAYFETTPAATFKPPIDVLHDLKDILENSRSACFRTNDPDFLIEEIYSLYSSSSHPMVIDLTPAMSVSELLVREIFDQEKTQDSALHFKIEKQGLFEALEQGQSVILNGVIPARLLQELAPLFSDNPNNHYLEFNGNFVPIKKGQIILVQPETAPPLSESLIPEITCSITLKDYRARLKSEKAEENRIIENLFLFFEVAEYPHRGDAMPADLGMKWVRLQAMKEALLAPRTNMSHQHNPIKDLMLNNYVKGGDDEYYEFLNVLCKYLFDHNPKHPIRVDKFNKRLAKRQPEPGNSLWYFLNTCNGEKLREILGEQWIKQSFTTSVFDYWKNLHVEQWKKTWAALQQKTTTETIAEIKDAIMETEKTKKIWDRLFYLIDSDQNASVIVVKGEPGVGKTHFLNILANKYPCIIGNVQPEAPLAIDNLEEFLKTAEKNPEKLLLFLADEINTAKPGMLNTLNGLYRRFPGIFYNNHFYKLNPKKHKIVAAVNPEYFPGRYRHESLQNGRIEMLCMSSAEDIEQWLLQTYSELENNELLAKKIVVGANFFKKHKPLEGYSYRDLQNLMARYILLQEQEEKASSAIAKRKILYAAFRGEFGSRIIDLKKQQQFMTGIAALLGLPYSKSSSESEDDVMGDVYDALQQALFIHKHVCETKAQEALIYKHGIVLQGASGIYESTLCTVMLEQRGLNYVTLDAVDPNFNIKAIDTFNQGKILLIENMQALSCDKETLLGSLLTGKFFLIGIKTIDPRVNSAPTSPALYNRVEFIAIPPTPSYWVNLADKFLPNKLSAQAYTKAYIKVNGPCHNTASLFFRDLKEEINSTQDEFKNAIQELENYIETRTTEQLSLQKRILDSRFFPRLKGYTFVQKIQSIQKLINILSGNEEKITVDDLNILLQPNSGTKNKIDEIFSEQFIASIKRSSPSIAQQIQPLVNSEIRQQMMTQHILTVLDNYNIAH